MRVPMDSTSGAQVLKFSGFTGRKGHGIVLHGRAMKAEGGADLDGDKSFIFFGGEGGMRNEWKEAYKSNKEEFYQHYKKGDSRIADNKEGVILTGKHKGKMYRDPLSITPSPEREVELTSKAFQYSPAERIRISEAAVAGRQLLGPAVNQKQLMSAAYSAIIANGGNDTIFMRLPGKKRNKKGFPIYDNYRVRIKARTDKKSQADQRGIGRAQVGLASAPLDELGLTGQDVWFRQLWNAHFKIEGKPQRIFEGRKPPVDVPIDDFMKKFSQAEPDSRFLRGGIYGNLASVNKAYWGRNWATGRKWNMLEIQAMGNKIGDIPTKAQDASIMSKTGKMLQGLDWSDSIFAKI